MAPAQGFEPRPLPSYGIMLSYIRPEDRAITPSGNFFSHSFRNVKMARGDGIEPPTSAYGSRPVFAYTFNMFRRTSKTPPPHLKKTDTGGRNRTFTQVLRRSNESLFALHVPQNHHDVTPVSKIRDSNPCLNLGKVLCYHYNNLACCVRIYPLL